MNTIEKLKDKDQARPYWLRTPEEQEILKAAGPKNCLKTTVNSYPEWLKVDLAVSNWDLDVYILKPDYEPEPEYIDIEIVVKYDNLRLKEDPPGGGSLRWIDYVPRNRYFKHFFDVECGGAVFMEDVATKIDDGFEIKAQFRRPK